MENNFETNMERPKIGAGIITLAVLTFIFNGFSLLSSGFTLINLDNSNKILVESGLAPISSTQIIISLLVTLVTIVSFILILCWKRLGVYLYYGSFVLGLIISFVSSNSYNSMMSAFFYIGIAISFIIPILLGVFLKSKFKFFT